METIAEQKNEVPYWMKHKPNAMFQFDAEAEPDKKFFKWWCTYLTPLVKLSPRELDVVASLLKQRHEMSKKVLDPALVDAHLLTDAKEAVIKECHISPSYYDVIKSNLRKNHILTEEGTISPRLIPNIRKEDNGYFQLLILFKDPEIK